MINTLILTEKKGWHFQQLKNSLEKNKHNVTSACLTDISLSIENNKSNIIINNNLLDEMDNVIVRFVPGGTLEEIVFYLNILKIFQSMNIKVINSATAIENTVDKLYTSHILNRNGIPTPKTYILRGYDKAKKFLERNIPSKGIIYKPLFGSQGDNIKLIKNINDLDGSNNVSNIFYFQEFLNNEINHDYRVLILRNKKSLKYFHMTRYGETFVNNISKGGSCKKEIIDPSIINLAIESSKLLAIDFCGVDIIKYKNKFYVIELNSIPAWKGLQNVENEHISEYFVNLLIK